LRFGDQPQLREDAVLAADEQAGARVGAAFGRHCDSALPSGARRKAIVAVADAARSRSVETNRPIEAVVAAQHKPDASRSRLLSH